MLANERAALSDNPIGSPVTLDALVDLVRHCGRAGAPVVRRAIGEAYVAQQQVELFLMEARATVGPAASRSARVSAASASCSGGWTALTRPHSRARSVVHEPCPTLQLVDNFRW
jgi:hypothetical protein